MRRVARPGALPELTRGRLMVPQRAPSRAAGVKFDRLLGTPPATVVVESVTEVVTISHRARTNNAPLATGRYRR